MKFDAVRLKQFTTRVFAAAGIPEGDAAMMAEVLVTTDMRGISSHGVVRSARYIDCIRAGGIKASGEPEVVAEGANFIRISADGGLGIPASVKTVDRLIGLARKTPVAVATVNHSDHFGAAGYYTMRCAEAGLVGFCMSNTCPLMAPTGGAALRIGNNPFAYSAPAGKYRAVLFDICMSTVACGKVEIAAAENRKIPFGWMLDKSGNPTNDPKQYFDGGLMLPFGGHKGYGLAVMVEIMTAILGQAGTLSEVHSWNTEPGRDANTGHCFFAFNPEFFGGLAQFEARMEQMIAEIADAPKAPGVGKIYYPGEIEFEKEAEAEKHGVALPPASVEQLRRAAGLAGIPFEP